MRVFIACYIISYAGLLQAVTQTRHSSPYQGGDLVRVGPSRTATAKSRLHNNTIHKTKHCIHHAPLSVARLAKPGRRPIVD